MESKIKIYSIVITLSIFVFALIAVGEIPNMFENVLAQQQPEGSQQDRSSSSSQQRSSEDSLRDLERRSSEQSEEDSLRLR